VLPRRNECDFIYPFNSPNYNKIAFETDIIHVKEKNQTNKKAKVLNTYLWSIFKLVLII